MTEEEVKKRALSIFNAALSSVNPDKAVKAHGEYLISFYRSKHIKKVFVIGFGKASLEMAKAINEASGAIIDKGIIITKYGHARGIKSIDNIEVYEAGHPIPDEFGVSATEKIIELLRKADQSTLVICLISGGGSALLVLPIEPIKLEEKQTVTRLLLEAGADINEINAVRKHISSVKGGRLAKIAYPAHIKSLILSDVIGDRLDVIASGPTTFDTTTYMDAVKVIKKYKLLDKIPENVIDVLYKGLNGEISETLKENDPVLANTENIIIGSNKIALAAAEKMAIELGFHTEILTSRLQGEAKKAGRWLAGIAKAYKEKIAQSVINKPVCLLSGGETTVKVIGSGKGGRNTELALSFAIEIDGMEGIFLISSGTDGTDGPTNAAGAYATADTIKKAKRLGMVPEAYLKNNDSYNFFKNIDGLLITGPTGTNVMDIQVIIVY